MKIFTTRVKTNLNGVLQMTQMVDGIMMTGDNAANQIIVELYSDFDKVQIAQGTKIVGYFIRSDGYTIETDGSVNESGEAVVIIPEIAYQVSGSLSIAIRMFDDEHIDTYRGYYKIIIKHGYYDSTSETSTFVEVDSDVTEGPHGEEVKDYVFSTNEFIQVTDDSITEGPNGEPVVTKTFNNWGTKIVIATLSCFVRVTESDSLIDVYHHIPDVQELLSYIEDLDSRKEQIRLAEEERVAAELLREKAEKGPNLDGQGGRVKAESDRITAESARAQAELDRIAAENVRAQSESDRITAESARAQAELDRIAAENIRAQSESDRITAESARAQAELDRIAAENIRDQSESDRIAAESARAQAENQRQSTFDDFIDDAEGNEAARVLAEQGRTDAEMLRQSQETTRQSQESTRQSQEVAREQAQAIRNTKIDDMTVEAIELNPYDTPTATITEVNGHKHIAFGLRPGDPFVIQKTFASIAEMEAYSGTDIRVGQFVIISSTEEDPDNAKMYVKTSSGYSFITDLSGAQGIQGPRGYTGNGIASVVLNADYTMTVNYTDGNSYTTPNSIRGVQGETGNGIALVEMNSDYTLTITFTNGTSFTTDSIRGVPGQDGQDGRDGQDGQDGRDGQDGQDGQDGAVGNGIASVAMDSTTYEMTITMTDGTHYTTPSLKGEPGFGGANFDFDSENSALTITYY